MEKRVVAIVKPRIDGIEKVEEILDCVMAHVMAAQDGLERAKAVTLEVTALAELDETTD